MIAVYGFEVPERGRFGSVKGLIAVIRGARFAIRLTPIRSRRLLRRADICRRGSGDAVCVAWQQGGFVYVCLIKGGADSLETLQNALGEPAA